MTTEQERLQQAQQHQAHWKRWGPYVSERQWGTVREDYSADGKAWSYLPHDQARSKTYRWGEDGLAGICDDHQYLCFALALWNGQDPILKERLFGLSNSQGNHGEDVKEYYYYLDNTPTHSYMKYLYKYPHAAYGIRSLSRYHLDHPFVLEFDGVRHSVNYEPAESTTAMFGGNSNWRGPIWFPLNYLIIQALQTYAQFYGEELKVEFPTGSGSFHSLEEVAAQLSRRLTDIFLCDGQGLRAVYGGVEVFQHDPHWQGLLQFYEYFHGDNGAGIGASHQTGWTGLVTFLFR